MILKIALAQFDPAWEAPEANRTRLAALLEGVEADVAVLPETFATGFAADPGRMAESECGATLGWMRRTAAAQGKALAGSVAVRLADGRFANRLYFVTPDGTVVHYDKRHLFSIGGEDGRFAAGGRRTVAEWRGVRFLLEVCYDLRFPVWSRWTPRSDYDVALYVASWPESRREAWRTLLRARAIENQAYVAGVNRVGSDPWNRYAGDSALVDPIGRTLAEAGEGERLAVAEIDTEALACFRTKFPVWRDADGFEIEM